MRQSLLLSLSLLVAMPTFAVRRMANVVCFVKFADQEDSDWQHTQDYYEAMFNNRDEGANSVTNYFSDMSYGNLELTSTLIPVVYVDSLPRSYYCMKTSINPDGYTDYLNASLREQTMLKRMCDFLDASLPDDVEVDINGDGKIDNLTVIIHGNSEISAERNLWPANTPCLWTSPTLNGKKVGYYLKVFDKANGYQGFEPQELNTGVICHEMMHTLDAPDLYSKGKLEPVGVWDLMSDNQKMPQGLSAYIRSTYGRFFGNWIPEIKELTERGRYTLKPLASATSTDVAYKIVPDGSKGEYFMVEYRNKSDMWDRSLPAAGMLVYRIDPQKSGNLSETRFEMYVFRPGGSTTKVGKLAQAPLGAATGRTSFGTEADADYPFYGDGSRAPFSISDVVETECGVEFTLTFGDNSGIDDIWADGASQAYYDRVKGEIIAPGAENVEIFSISGLRISSLSDAPKGVYLARIGYPDGTVKTIKFVK